MSAKQKSIASDLKKVDQMKENEINYSDIPPLDDSFFEKQLVSLPKKKDSITLRIDHDVLEFFKHQGRGYQTLINAVLKTYVTSVYNHLKQKRHKLKRK